MRKGTIPLRARLLLCVRVGVNAAYLAPPLVPALFTRSTLWNIIWWVAFVVWVNILIAQSGDAALVGIAAALAAVVGVIEIDPSGRLWFYLVGLFVMGALSTSYRIYKAQALRMALQMLHE